MKALTLRIVLVAVALLLALIGVAIFLVKSYRTHLLVAADEWIESRMMPDCVSPPKPTGPDAASYDVLCEQLRIWRVELAERHKRARTAEVKATIENEARIVLEHMLPAMMRCWIGTKWDFNGTAAKPGEGKIACGYFVSTVLRDAGLEVNRFRLAQQASSNIILTFIDEADTTRAYNQKYEIFIAGMAESPVGVYICGLDTHVGFVINRSDGFRFIHSSGSAPHEVVDESPEDAGVLQRSKDRMLGNLTANRGFIRTWLAGKPIAVKRN